MTTMSWKGYLARIDYDQALKMFHGRVINANSVITFYGASVEELEREFAKSMTVYFDVCREQGIKPDKPYSGRFNIRMSPEQHGKFVAAATEAGKSLSAWAVETLEKAV